MFKFLSNKTQNKAVLPPTLCQLNSEENVVVSVNSIGTQIRTKICTMKYTIDEYSETLKSLMYNERSKRATPIGVFRQPDSMTTITALKNEIKEIKNTIDKLKLNSSNSSEDKSRILLLENSLEILQKQLDMHRKVNSNLHQEFELDIKKMTSSLNSFNKELDSLRNKLEQKVLSDDCIDFIRKNRLEDARQKLYLITDNTEINRIIKIVYDHEKGNFDLIVRFGQSIKDINKKFYVFDELHKEMDESNLNPLDVITLMKEVKIIAESKINNDITKKYVSLYLRLQNLTKKVVKEKLKDGFLNDKLSTQKHIIDKVCIFQIALSDEIIKELINDIYGQMNKKKLVEHVSNFTYFEQIVTGYVAIFENIKNTNILEVNEEIISALLELSKKTKDTLNYLVKNYPNDDNSLKKHRLRKIISELPNLELYSTVKLSRTVYQVGRQFSNVEDLKNSIKIKRSSLSQDSIQNLFKTLPNRKQ